MRTTLALTILLVVTLATTACGGGQATATDATTTIDAAPVATIPAEPAVDADANAPALRATLTRPDEVLVAFAEPDAGTAVVAELAPTTDLGSARVLAVEEQHPGWVRVALPVRPNGTTGWVADADVVVDEVDARVDVDLAARTLTVRLGDEVVLSTPVAVGTAENPTPAGRFSVTDRVRPPDPNGAYGDFALGLSAYSDTLSEFAGRDGQVGIHGTDAPDSIGRAASHGCVRVPAEATAILARLPLGTPVVIA